MAEPRVADVPERSRYELNVADDTAGHLTYDDVDGARRLTHTVVYDDFKGRGLASTLVRSALEDNRASARTVVPVCTYVQGYLRQHGEYADILADGGSGGTRD